MDNFYYYIIIVNILLSFKLYWDHRARTKDGRVINHGRSLLIDMFIYSGASIILFGVSWSGLVWVFLATMYRGLLFDLFYNLIFHNKWSYCGDSSKIDEWSDDLDGKSDDDCILGFFLKIVLILLGITLIILL